MPPFGIVAERSVETSVVFDDAMLTEMAAGARAGFPCASVRVTTRRPPPETGTGFGWARILIASGEGPWTVTVPDPEFRPDAEPVIVAVPVENPTL